MVKKVKTNNGTAINYIERNKQIIKQPTNYGITGAINGLFSTATKKLGLSTNFGFGTYFRP